MIKISKLFFLFLLLPLSILGQNKFPKPDSILAETNLALSSLSSISYHGEHYTIGLVEVKGKTMASITVSGDVTLSREPNLPAFGAKFFVDGKIINSNPNTQSLTFKTAFNGEKVFKQSYREKKVYVNDPNQIGKMLFAEASYLVYNAFMEPSNFTDVLSSDSLHYAGSSIIAGTPCHTIYIQQQNGEKLIETWLFVSQKDAIPRKILKRFTGTDGQNRMEVTQFSNLRINEELSPSQFTVQTPTEYQVTKFKGFGQSSSSLATGDQAPSWTLEDPEGNKHSLEDYLDSIIVLDFWATWCGPCRKAMPKLQKIHEKFSSQDVKVVGVSTWENGNPAEFMSKNHFTYQLLLNGDEVADKYNVTGLPTLFIIDTNGEVIYSEVGTDKNSYQNIINTIKKKL